MAWVTTAVMVGTALYSASQQKSAANKSARAQKSASDAAIGEQARQYDQTRTDQQPWMQAGQGALSQMQSLNSGDFSSFKASPDYQFAFDQGLQGLDRSAAARGSLLSGGHSADVMKFGQGLASQNYGAYYDRLSKMAGQGSTTASGLGQMGQQYANNVGQIGLNQANNMASSYQQNANTNSQLAGVIGGAANSYFNKASAVGAPTSNGLGGGYSQPAAGWNASYPSFNGGSNWNVGTAGTGTGH